MKDKEYFNKLKKQREIYIKRFNWALQEYRRYQEYFKRSKTPRDAEYFFRREKESACIGSYDDVMLSMHHRTLKQRMEENRKERNDIVEQIKVIKELMKKYNRELSQE